MPQQIAGRFPALNPAEIDNPGKRSVARAVVEHLPNRVEILHNFNWLSRNRDGPIMEGECDVALLDAEYSLLFAKVKRGSLLSDKSKWVREVRGEHRMLTKAPFAQAKGGMHKIVEPVTPSLARIRGYASTRSRRYARCHQQSESALIPTV